jgi:hypothetical protein
VFHHQVAPHDLPHTIVPEAVTQRHVLVIEEIVLVEAAHRQERGPPDRKTGAGEPPDFEDLAAARGDPDAAFA